LTDLVTPPRALGTRLAPLAAASALSLCSVAQASPAPQRTAAEMLDAEGTSLMQAHRYAEACPKLAESERLEPGTGVLLRLGLCYEELGRTASAWSVFRDAAARAQRSGDESVRQLATKRADVLEPRVPKVIFRAAPGTEHEPVEVRCDGAPLDRAAIGAEIPLDPGTHTVQATLPGRRTFRTTFTLAPQTAVLTIAIELPVDAVGSSDSGGAARAPPSDSVQRNAGLVVGGVGVAGIVVGSIFGAVALSNWNRAKSECTSGTSGCSQDALSLQPVVQEDALWSTVAFVAGAMGLVGGVLLWGTAPKPGTAANRGCTIGPVMGGNRLGLEIEGRF
jgi:hypothetical protein